VWSCWRPIATISNWAARRANPELVVERIAYRFQLERALRVLERRGRTLAIIDTPGSHNDFVADAMWLTFVSFRRDRVRRTSRQRSR
jgi:hypothetical protein